MGRVAELVTIVQREVEAYAEGYTYKSITYPISDAARRAFAVLVIPEQDYPLKSRAGIIVAAHVTGEYVVIDEDITDRPLWEALVRAGIPRENIICYYAGESLPETTKT